MEKVYSVVPSEGRIDEALAVVIQYYNWMKATIISEEATEYLEV